MLGSIYVEGGEASSPMNTEMVPLISGVQAGPLGVAHLPRLWFKMRAHAAGVLPEGYRRGNGGDDEAVLAAIGVDGEAFACHIASDVPDYLACC